MSQSNINKSIPFHTVTTHEQDLSKMLEEAYSLRLSNIMESIGLAREVLATADKNNYSFLKASAQNQLGLFLMIRGEYQGARLFSFEALKYFEVGNNLKGIADAKYNIASTYYKTDDFHEGLQWLLDCLLIYRKLKDFHNQARVLKAMGTIYEYFGDVENAIESYEKSIVAARTVNDPSTESNAYNPLSGIYLKKGLVNEAMEMAEKSIRIKIEANDERGLAFSLYGRGKVYLSLQKYAEALVDFKASLKIQVEMGDRLGEGMVLNKMGLVYIGLKDYENAEKALLSALHLGEQYNVRLIRYKAYFNLHQLFKMQSKWKKAAIYLEKYITYKDAAISMHTLNVIKSYDAIKRLEIIERESKAQNDYLAVVQNKNAELDSFFYRVSHDLKGPIASLLGLHNLVKYEKFDERAEKYFDMYHQQLMRINMIVMDLIEITRLEQTQKETQIINFRQIAEDCVNSFTYYEHFKDIRFMYEIDEAIVFNSYWIIINTILQNLIENSIKYSRQGADSYIKIGVSKEGERIKIVVEDNGQGIHESLQGKIFEMFFRANESSNGSGLGLYILKRAVERLGGEIVFKSKPGEGTIFTVLLSEMNNI